MFWSASPHGADSRAREYVDRHRLDFFRLQLVVECRHEATPPFRNRFDDRSTVRAIKIQAGLGEIGRSNRLLAAAVLAMAVETVTLGVVEKQGFAAGSLGDVELLAAELQDVLGNIVDLGRIEIFV